MEFAMYCSHAPMDVEKSVTYKAFYVKKKWKSIEIQQIPALRSPCWYGHLVIMATILCQNAMDAFSHKKTP